MKGNKPMTYVLIAGVLMVWGLVFYRVFSDGTESTLQTSNTLYKASNTKSSSFAKDNFELLLSYRDPFLSHQVRAGNGFASFPSEQRVGSAKVKKKVKEVVPVVAIDWSFISYLGLVANKVQNKNIGLVVINNKEYMVNEGDCIENVTIVKKSKDSINVSYNKEKKWIKRQ
ncbi:MAG: hypothetical protein K0R51_2909 [Cytophagaceae bacterium]|jgi:hypothetical protein|nr:hypothetical protein [Cytophagaceae bacterium]